MSWFNILAYILKHVYHTSFKIGCNKTAIVNMKSFECKIMNDIYLWLIVYCLSITVSCSNQWHIVKNIRSFLLYDWRMRWWLVIFQILLHTPNIDCLYVIYVWLSCYFQILYYVFLANCQNKWLLPLFSESIYDSMKLVISRDSSSVLSFFRDI